MESGQAQERVTAVRGAGGQEQIAVLTAGAKALFAAGARRGPPPRGAAYTFGASDRDCCRAAAERLHPLIPACHPSAGP